MCSEGKETKLDTENHWEVGEVNVIHRVKSSSALENETLTGYFNRKTEYYGSLTNKRDST